MFPAALRAQDAASGLSQGYHLVCWSLLSPRVFSTSQLQQSSLAALLGGVRGCAAF